ncbi:MAG: lactoylglutathione lyase [Magnetococcales bacterium]|nr:lactoylglutathione lyase [Magnetococcales bacterium]
MQNRILHTMIRVRNLEKSVHFYSKVLGMTELRRKEYPGGRFTLCFLGFEATGHQVELTYNWDQDEDYSLGNGFGHIAIGSEDIYSMSKKILAAGGEVVREPGPMKHGTTHIAFVRDPDGYAIELIQE